MSKSLIEFNREYTYKCYVEETTPEAPKKNAPIKTTVFYSALIIIVLFTFFWSNNNAAGKRFGPFAYNSVLSTSMQSAYPKGSLVASWAIKPDDKLKAGLADGDDIVFVTESGKIIVHRVVEIMENYDDSGLRAFRTQGIENSAPDTFITYEGNIIGRVVWHTPHVGKILASISENFFLIIAIITVVCIFVYLLKIAILGNAPKKEHI